MKKFLRILAMLCALGIAFLAGWRIMPKIWPTLKQEVIYRVLPVLEPTPAPTREPYVPSPNADFGDAIAADESLIYYFYRPTCPYCSQIDPLLSGLPEEVTLPGGNRSKIRMIAVNKSDETDGAFIQQYYEDHAIPEEDQTVPTFLIGNRYLDSFAEIMSDLYPALLNGEGLKTPRY